MAPRDLNAVSLARPASIRFLEMKGGRRVYMKRIIEAATQETPSQKGSGKGSGAAPGVSAEPPKDPVPPPAPTAEKEKEATQPTQVDQDSVMQDAQAR